MGGKESWPYGLLVKICPFLRASEINRMLWQFRERRYGNCPWTGDTFFFVWGMGRSQDMGSLSSIRDVANGKNIKAEWGWKFPGNFLLEISIYKATSTEACKFSLHATLFHRVPELVWLFSTVGLQIQAEEQELKDVIKERALMKTNTLIVSSKIQDKSIK